LGLLFALAFVARGVERIDPGRARHRDFHPFAASVALWPCCSVAGGASARSSDAHRRAACAGRPRPRRAVIAAHRRRHR
jgi:hypothetical protein